MAGVSVRNQFEHSKSLLVRAHLRRPAAPPTATVTGWGEEPLDRAVLHRSHGPVRSHIGRTGRLRVASQDVTIHMSAHAPPPEQIRARIDWQS